MAFAYRTLPAFNQPDHCEDQGISVPTIGTSTDGVAQRRGCYVVVMTTSHHADVAIAIDGGLVHGCLDGPTIRYLGIPYAAPPTRFELPQAPPAWDGVRDMADPGPAAPHRIKPFPEIDPSPLIGHGNDCLLYTSPSPRD